MQQSGEPVANEWAPGDWPHPATTRGKGKSRVMAALSILPLMPLVALVEIDFEHGTQCENGRVSLD